MHFGMHQKTYKNMLISTIHNKPKLETTQCLSVVIGWLNRHHGIFINEMLSCNEGKEITATHKNVDKLYNQC